MIEETKKKIHFFAYSPLKGKARDTSDAPTVSINQKYSRITFGRGAIQELQMENKFIRFYYEPVKKIIGWQMRSNVSQSEMKNWKVVKVREDGMWFCTFKKLLDTMRLRKNVYLSIPIQKYREINPLSEYKDQIFYFIEMIDDPDELRKGIGNETVQNAETH